MVEPYREILRRRGLLIRFRYIALVQTDLDSFGLLFWNDALVSNLKRTDADGKGPDSSWRVTFLGCYPECRRSGISGVMPPRFENPESFAILHFRSRLWSRSEVRPADIILLV
jgi:hypothetical protein